MIGVTLRHMRYFSALAAHRHFGRAAEACAISQPALSLQIKELEEMLGAPLVERTARQMHLTTLGEDFLERIQDILVRVDDLEQLVRSSKDGLTGRLRLGIIPTVAPYLLPRVIQTLGERFPDVEIEPRESVTQSLVDGLLSSQLDIAILALPISDPALREFALFDEEFYLVRPQSEADAPVPSAASLEAMRLLLLEEGHCFRDQALSFCEMSGARPKHIMEGSSLSTLVQMVGAGIGATLIPEMALDYETRSAEVCVARFQGQRPRRTIGMIWRKASPLGEQFMTIGASIRTLAEAGQKKRTPSVSAAI
ncbi:hydrogen peroxide-inducible genes activator [Cognatiyoonia sp. IB215182]|uniref:hydrogen peroxide-inducible genes activator n=1 Tax=Cognatiyoonia sp. IB215182 TaxID=3097353 RepID=UPI002A1388A7|nr:hydrogen peroxide-inducible genes activator [Cognatiyoonia sp. IB215182]MDX8354013.1 hydrogen peroxide-inducible genes activator [Cognatiyoonia sp. IB215182]